VFGAVVVLLAALVGAYAIGRSNAHPAASAARVTGPTSAPLAEGRVDASIKADLQTTATAVAGWYASHPDLRQLPVWSSGFAPALHPGNHIDIKVAPGVNGFCLDGWDTAGSATGPNGKLFFFYDSIAGGLQQGGPASTPPSAALAANPCGGTSGFRSLA
jgi:hypothetical protein